MTVEALSETRKGFSYVMLSGPDLMQLTSSQKNDIAGQVSELLKSQSTTMLQFAPDELLEKYINKGDASALLAYDTGQLIGFAKNHRWPGENENGQSLYEFGSWLVKAEYLGRGYGELLALIASETIREKDPNSQLVAVCSVDNPKPIALLQKLGAREIPKPSNLDIILGEGNAKVVILDMTTLDNSPDL